MRHIAEDLIRWAREGPESPFITEESGQTYTYGEVLGRARRFAGGLIESGIQPGDRVLLLLPNGIDYLAAYYGTLLVGAIAVGLQPGTTTRALEHVTANCQPKLLVVDPGRGATPELSDLARHPVEELSRAAPLEESPAGGGTDIAQIIYTSGTTGKAKGVTLSHAALRANTDGIVEYLELTASDRVGVVLDFVYSYGNSLLQTHCRVGGSLALLGSMAFPVNVAERLEQRACTGLSGVPSTFALLLQRGHLENHSLPSLRYLTCAGGALPTANLHRLQRLFPDVKVFLMYGQTEASARLSYLPPQQLRGRPNSIGTGMPGVTLEVLAEDGRPISPGEEGEIVASGENLMTGYWNDPEATAAVIVDGKLWTGDLAMVDEDGFIFITGRRSDLIKTGAYRVHPKEVEEAIVEMDGIHECVVVGAPHETWGEVIVACFLKGTAPPLPQVRKHLRGKLPEYKWPREVFEVDQLPRTASGKAKRRELLALLGADRAGD
ncbi:MAG: acyl--CoA ligase [Gemmatimonadota bacterium]|nr:MAG: acyl--CoA ligase [Gemmatimonadota bacterium]